MRHRTVVVALALLALAGPARAEEWGLPPAPEPAPAPAPAPAPGPEAESPWLTPDELHAPAAPGALVCDNAVCRCVPGPRGRCDTIECRCADELPETSPFLPDAALPPATTQPAVDPELSQPDARLAAPGARPDLSAPVPSAGFLLSERRVGFRLEAGFPFIDVDLLVRAHDVVQLGLGYRTLWTFTHAGYGEIKFRLWRNEAATRGLSLLLRGGYTYQYRDDGDTYDYNYNTSLVGGDSGFGELLLGLSIHGRRHAFDLQAGLRLGWVQEALYDEWDYYTTVFSGGDAGMLATVIIDAGYALRMTRSSSFVVGFGVDVFTNSDAYRALPRGRVGFVVEL